MGVNKVILIGNLGKDPELAHLENGTAKCTFTLATSERYKTKAGEPITNTTWHNIVVWRELAEVCGKYLRKGAQVYVEGKIHTRSWEDKEGQKRFITEITVDQMQMLGAKTEGGTQANAPQTGGNAAQTPDAYSETGELTIPDDDLPF